MKIKMTATKNELDEHVFRLMTDDPIDVVVTGSKGTEQLKAMFGALLIAMVSDEVEVDFEKTDGYDNMMYEEVCKEYVAVLNEELSQARERLDIEGLCKG